MDPHAKDHYTTLGVARSEHPSGIHEAYRRLAKQYHPDYAGEAATAKFQAIQEAYEVLSDHDKRTSYDLDIAQQSARGSRSRPVRQSRRSPVAPEPLIRSHPIEPLVKPVSPRSFGLGRYTAPNPEDLEIVLSSRQATSGVAVQIPIVAMRRCSICNDMENDPFSWSCILCGGTGVVEEHLRIALSLPADLQDCQVVEIPALKTTEITTRPFRLYIRVQRPSF
jgi:DnaJ-class molecular chaperone